MSNIPKGYKRFHERPCCDNCKFCQFNGGRVPSQTIGLFCTIVEPFLEVLENDVCDEHKWDKLEPILIQNGFKYNVLGDKYVYPLKSNLHLSYTHKKVIQTGETFIDREYLSLCETDGDWTQKVINYTYILDSAEDGDITIEKIQSIINAFKP